MAVLLQSPSQIDAALRRGVWFIIVGFPVLVGAVIAHGPTLAPMTATALGAMCGAFAEWRRERGLWMLSIAFLVLYLPMYATFAIVELFGSSAEINTLQVVDFALGTILLEMLCRLLMSITVQNWRLGGAVSKIRA